MHSITSFGKAAVSGVRSILLSVISALVLVYCLWWGYEAVIGLIAGDPANPWLFTAFGLVILLASLLIGTIAAGLLWSDVDWLYRKMRRNRSVGPPKP